MDSLQMFAVAMRVLEVGASIVTAVSLLAIAIHECTSPTGIVQRRRKR